MAKNTQMRERIQLLTKRVLYILNSEFAFVPPPLPYYQSLTPYSQLPKSAFGAHAGRGRQMPGLLVRDPLETSSALAASATRLAWPEPGSAKMHAGALSGPGIPRRASIS